MMREPHLCSRMPSTMPWPQPLCQLGQLRMVSVHRLYFFDSATILVVCLDQ